jgi:hypothetical protein
MANTANITAIDSDWTLVHDGVGSGFLTNESKVIVMYRENTSAPDPGDNQPTHSLGWGHARDPDFRYDILAGSKVFVKSTNGDALLAHTPDQ